MYNNSSTTGPKIKKYERQLHVNRPAILRIFFPAKRYSRPKHQSKWRQQRVKQSQPSMNNSPKHENKNAIKRTVQVGHGMLPSRKAKMLTKRVI